MTENKRFTIENDIEMKDNWNINKRCYHFGNGFDAKDCCNMLNELLEEKLECENEIARLELIVNNLKDKDYDNYKKKIQELEKENKKLKYHLNETEKELEEYKDFMSLG